MQHKRKQSTLMANLAVEAGLTALGSNFQVSGTDGLPDDRVSVSSA